MGGVDLTAAVWTGRDVILAGADPLHGGIGVGAYDPAAGHWQVITPVLPAGHPARSVAMVATVRRVILWSLWDRVKTYNNTLVDRAGVDVLALGQDGTWRDVTGDWPQNQDVKSPVFTGAAIAVSPGQAWCGTRCVPPYTWNPGYLADPATLARKVIPAWDLAAGQAKLAFIWAGRAIIAIDLDAGGPGSQYALQPYQMAPYDMGV